MKLTDAPSWVRPNGISSAVPASTSQAVTDDEVGGADGRQSDMSYIIGRNFTCMKVSSTNLLSRRRPGRP